MSEIWEIIPLEGIGPLKLGMSYEDVDNFARQLGKVDALDKQTLPSGQEIYKEYRDLEAPFLTYYAERLIDISVDHHTRFNIQFENTSVFENHSKLVLQTLQAREGAAYWGLGNVIFPTLSIATQGFLVDLSSEKILEFWEDGEEKPPKVITVAGAGAYDEFLSRYERISIE